MSKNNNTVVYRYLPEYNYRALWRNNVTVRFVMEGDDPKYIPELPPEESEFYDVGINDRCDAGCPFCYVSANKNGTDFSGIIKTWKKLSQNIWYQRKIGQITVTNGPVQIAIGSTGEPTQHPDFPEFLKIVKESGVVPNYTTNGLLLGYSGKDQEIIKRRDNLLDVTEKYCSAVAISLGNKNLREAAIRAIENLIPRDIHVVTHHIISDLDSVLDFFEFRRKYGKKIHYYTLLPLAKSGRSEKEMSQGVYNFLESEILFRQREIMEDMGNISFGAKFIPYVKSHGNLLNACLIPEGAYSKNMLIKDDKVIITPSSFDLTPIKIINL